MTDAELGEALGFTPEEALIAIPRITPEKRAFYEHMLGVADAVARGERPPGVIVCRPSCKHG